LMTNNENTGAMMTGIEAREFALLYEVTHDQKYLDEARARLEKSKVAWNESVDSYNAPAYSSGQFTFYTFSCWTELAETEIARASNDNQALTNAKNFFNSANIGNNYVEINQLSALQPCAETLLNLYQQTADIQYYNQARAIMQYIITYRWDSPSSIATKYNGDGGYLFELFTGNNTKTVTDTGYMIYLLSQMPNQQFEILSWR